MPRTGYVYDTGMLAHHDPAHCNHPETPGRLVSIVERFESSGLLEQCEKIDMKIDDISEIPQVHSTTHHDQMLRTSQMDDEGLEELARGYDSIYLCKDTARSALLAVGSTVALAKAISSGKVQNGFAIVRPPGHHAEYDKPMGFCIYNNVAVAVKALLAHDKSVQRVLVLDWDVHHGNGTQNAFIEDPRVLFISLHRYDNGRFYPHNVTADMFSVGEGPGIGKNVNIPWPRGGFGDAEYLHAFHRLVMPIANEFNPDFVFVSAGFDAAVGDPIGECQVSPAGYAHMTHLLKSLAGGKLLLALEGGYNIEAVANSSEACMRTLLGEQLPRLAHNSPPHHQCISVVERVVKVHSPYWSSLVPKSEPIPSGALETSLEDITKWYWSHVCKTEFDLLELPIFDDKFVESFSGRVHVSDEIMGKAGTLVLVAHEADSVVQQGPSIEGNILNCSTTSYLPAFKGYIEEISRSGASLIDVYIPARVWKLRQTSVGTDEEKALYNDFFAYLWDKIIEPSNAKDVFIIANGYAKYAIGKLIDAKKVESKIRGIYIFSSTLYLPIVLPEKARWYQQVSRVYVPGSGQPMGKMIPTKDVYGRCFSAGPDGPLQALNVALSAKTEILDLILPKIKNK